MAKVFIGNVKGPQGEKGDTGARGPQGIQGEKGDTGARGPQGIQGEKGDTGARGPQGIQGEKGDTGARGPQGIQGEKGDTGPQGPQGIQGPAGESGASYEAGAFTGILSNSSNSNIASAKGMYEKIEGLVYIYVAIPNMTGTIPNKLRGLPFVTAGVLSMNNKSELFVYDSEKRKTARPGQIAETDEVLLTVDDVSGMGCVELWGWYHV